MTESQDPARPKARVQRHQRHPQATEQRRRLQFGTGCPHRGPAPACQQRQITYQPSAAGARRPAGRLRVLQISRP